jgi:hypothetical protein
MPAKAVQVISMQHKSAKAAQFQVRENISSKQKHFKSAKVAFKAAHAGLTPAKCHTS